MAGVRPWDPLVLFAAIIVTAALINRFAPTKRPRLRRTVLLFACYAIATGVSALLPALGAPPPWVARVTLVADLLELLVSVHVASALVLDLALVRVGVDLPTIAEDLIVGLGYVVSVLAVLRSHGMDPTSVLATSAVLSAVLAISLQSTLGNVLGGVALQVDGSIKAGDWVQLENGRQGRVREVRWRHTVIETRDWATMIVPNASLLQGHILLLGRRDSKDVPFRMWVWFAVDYDFAPSLVIDTVTTALRDSPIENVAATPAPNVVCMDFGRDTRDGFALYAARYWLEDLAHDDPTSSRVRERIHSALSRARIPLARPVARRELLPDGQTRAETSRLDERRMSLSATRAIELFRGLGDQELAQLADSMERVDFSAGERITRQGAVAHFLYILASGSAEVRARGASGATKTVATVRAPTFVGEMGLMTGAPRLADVVATTPVTCFRLGKSGFESVLMARPEIAEIISSMLASRQVELLAIESELDEPTRQAREASERERILRDIKAFFGLGS